MTCQCEHAHETSTPVDTRSRVPAWVPLLAVAGLVALGWVLGGLAGALVIAPTVLYAGWLAWVDRSAGRSAVMLRLSVAALLAAMAIVQPGR